MNIINQFSDAWSVEKEITRTKFRNRRKKKVDFLSTKYDKNDDVPDKIRGVTVADQDIVKDFSMAPRVYGAVELSNDEEKLLTLPPKFTIPELIDQIECQTEVEKSLGKLRWELQKERKEANGNLDDTERTYFDANTMTFNYSNMRGTDLPYNKRIQLPKPVDTETEIKMQDLKFRLKSVTNKYLQNTNKSDNLNLAERKGLKSLNQKIKENEIVVYQTDKSGRFSVDSCENYKLSCQEHIINDQVITLEEYKEIEKNANFHAKTWARISQAGVFQRDTKRIKENLTITDTQPPPLYTSRKDHKETEDDEIGPPTRPICGVVDSATDRLSYVLSSVLNEIWKRNTETVCMSTEELKAEIEKVNRNITG